MKNLRSFLYAACALLALTSLPMLPATPANLPLLSGPIDPGNLLGTFNQVIQSVNSGVGGLLNAQTAAVSTGAGTAEQVLQTYTMPANTLSAAGQSVRVRCWGVTAATANNKTRKIYVGAMALATAAEAANAQPWSLEINVMRTAAATQQYFARGLAGTGGITNLQGVGQGTDDLTAGVVIKCTATDGTDAAGDVTANGMITEMVK